MNQATNRTPYGLMTDYEKSFFKEEDKLRGCYKSCNQSPLEGEPRWIQTLAACLSDRAVYRLSILPDIYYHVDGKVKLGSELPKDLEEFKVLRLAKNCEIPIKKKTGDELINHLCWVWDHDENKKHVAKVLKMNRCLYMYDTGLDAFMNAEEVSDAFIDSCPNLKALKTMH